MKDLPDFLRDRSEQAVVYHYLELLAQRNAELEFKLRQVQTGASGTAQAAGQNAAPAAPAAPAAAPAPAVAPVAVAGFSQLTAADILDLLPVIFDGLWDGVDVQALALVAARLGLHDIDRHRRELSREEINRGAKRIVGLARSELGALLQLCRTLPMSLKVRREMGLLVNLEFAAWLGRR